MIKAKHLKFLMAFIFLQTILNNAPAQNSSVSEAVVKGIVVDSTSNLPLEFATIILMKGDKDVVKTDMSAMDGTFKLTTNKNGNFILCISLVGYKKYYSQEFSITRNKIKDLGRINLQGDKNMLNEVVVVGAKALVQNKGDKLVYNAKADIGNKSGSAIDVLRNTPMVTVDAGGEIKLRGNGNIKVLLNGLPSNIMAKNLKEALKTIPAGTIESIEVITTPSAKYEAEGAAGIINIITKKKIKGTNGSVDLSGGNLEQSGNLELNMAKEKFDYSLSLNTSRENERSISELKRTSFLNGTETGNLLQNAKSTQKFTGLGLDFTANYQNDSTQKIGTSISYWKGSMPLSSNIYNLFENTLNKLEYSQTSEQKFKFSFIDFSLHYQKKFKRKGQELQLISQYSNSDDNSDYKTNQKYLSGQQYYGESSHNTSNSNDLNFQADYSHPIDKTGKNILETGLRYGRNSSKSDYSVFDNNLVQDFSRSDNMNYYQNIYAAYLSLLFETQIKWTFRPGLRYEATGLGGDFKRNEPSFKASFANWVPGFLISKKIGEKHDIKLNYTERIRRPFIWDLNPFVNASDPRNLSYGNPRLRPEITRMLEAGYMYSATSGLALTNSLYFNSNTNGIESITEVDSSGISRTTPRNIATINRLGSNLNIYMPVNSNWIISSDVEFYHVWFKSKALQVKNDANFYSVSVNSSYKLPSEFTIQLSADYNNGMVSLQGKSSSFYTYRLSIRKEFYENKASLTLNVNNPFQNKQLHRNYLNAKTFNSKSSDWYYNRSFTIAFSWRFGGAPSEKEYNPSGMDDQHKQEGLMRRLPGKK